MVRAARVRAAARRAAAGGGGQRRRRRAHGHGLVIDEADTVPDGSLGGRDFFHSRRLRRQADVSEALPIRGPADQGMLAQYQQ